MRNIFKFLTPTLVVILFTLIYVLYDTNTKYNQLEVTKTALIDSLREEVFILKVEGGRHEITRDEIFNKYPQVGKEYQQFYNHETE